MTQLGKESHSMEDYRVSLSGLPRQRRSPTFIRGKTQHGLPRQHRSPTLHRGEDSTFRCSSTVDAIRTRLEISISFPWRPFTVPKEIKCSWEISPGVVAGGTGGGERGVLWGTWRHGSPSIQFGSMTRVQWVPVRPPGQTRSESATGQFSGRVTAEVRWGPRYPVGNPPPLR